VRVENLTLSSQQVELRFESQPWAIVRARVFLSPGEHRQVPLLLPASARFGQLIASDGHDEGRDGFSWHYQSRDAILVEGPTAGATILERGKPSESGSSTAVPAVAAPRGGLPETLPALVGYSAVVVLETAFEELPEPQRRAVEAYAATGGALYLPRVPAHPEAFLPLWRGVPAEGPHPYGLGTLSLYDGVDRCVAAVMGATDIHRAGFLPQIGSGRYRSLSEPSSDPLIDVARVPVGGFLALVLLFVLVIGPGSFVVRARRGPHALLLFIPLTSLATCGGIASYGFFHEGLFTLHASSRTVTLLDSERHRAITESVDGFYASLAPSAVRFGALTAVVLPQEPGQLMTSLDETDGLTFRGGFIPSRAYREHHTLSVAPARGRLSVRGGAAALTVQNALGAELVEGLVGVGGRQCLVYNVPEGGEGPATCLAPGEVPTVLDRLGKGLAPRFSIGRLSDGILAPVRDGEFLVSLRTAVFAPDGALSLSRAQDFQVVRGGLAP
jgi:hypothetical protein